MFSCKSENEITNQNDYFFCGAENLTKTEHEELLDDGFGSFNASGYRTNETAFEGNYSIKLDTTKPYGFSYKIYDLKPEEYLEISIWIKNPVGKSALVASINGLQDYTIASDHNNKMQEKNGWSNYLLTLQIDNENDSLTVFAFSGNETHYFDNIEIRKYTKRSELPDSLKETALNIFIPDSNKLLLDNYVATALKNDLISSNEKQYVNAFIINQNNDSTAIEMRLKGDWTDHIENGKTSYRIKAEKSYQNLVTFSIQHPQTRNYMHEWFMHRWCDEVDLLSTTYFFAPVIINNNNQGIYAIEEHFDKQLIESRSRREGPIVKFDESGFWAVYAKEKGSEINRSFPYYESSMVTCFKDGRTEKSNTLSNQFINATNLMYLLKSGAVKANDLFNVNQLAKFYALMDIGNVYHSLAWHNRRYYYNPITTKLEIIGFDMIPASEPMNNAIMLENLNHSGKVTPRDKTLDFFLINDEKFKNSYLFYLNLFSSKDYLDTLFHKMNDEIIMNENLLNIEFKNYKFDTSFYYKKAKFIQKQIPEIEKKWDAYSKLTNHNSPEILPPNYPPLQDDFYLKEISVNAYRKMIDTSNFTIQIENYHLAEITIVGYGTKRGEDSIFFFDEAIKLNRYDGYQVPYAEISVTKKPSKIYFTLSNVSGVMQSKKIDAWPKPTGKHPRIELAKKFKLNSNLYRIKDDTLTFKKGHININELIYIPNDFVVVFDAGAQINFTNYGGLIINNDAYFNGTAEDSIYFYSTDKTAQGITILESNHVQVSYTHLNNLSSLNHQGWTLTGAFTVYSGNTSINHLQISNNNCEDALNIIRGYFDIKNLYIHHTLSDAFDADFCNGNLQHAKFENTGNDCIDFSGSVVFINDVAIKNAGDKGISSGEQSNLVATKINIDGAWTAVASKDGSKLIVTQGTAKNCEIGAALYKKKPEYPNSFMELQDIAWESTKQITLLEIGSKLKYINAYYTGNQYLDIDSMYARFKK